jgi:hypothetical protein
VEVVAVTEHSLPAQLRRAADRCDAEGDTDAAHYIRGIINTRVDYALPPTLDLSAGRMQRITEMFGCDDPTACVMSGFHAQVR